MARPRALLLVLLAAALAAPAAGVKFVGALGEPGELQCSELKECFCIRDTNCGWCPGSGTASLEPDGCVDWITDAFKCSTFVCSTGSSPYYWWAKRLCTPLVCSSLLVWAIIIRARAEGQKAETADETKTVVRAVTYCTGQASAMGNFDSDLKNAPRESKEFFGQMRTYDAFRLGPACPVEQRLPTETKRPYSLSVVNLSPNSVGGVDIAHVAKFNIGTTMSIALQWRTALTTELVPAFSLMLVSCLFISGLTLAAHFFSRTWFVWISSLVGEIWALITSLQVGVSLLLSFYALERINWFWLVMKQGFQLQGRTHDIGMICGGALGDTEAEWEQRYTLYRHLVVGIFFTYQPFTPCLQFVGFRPLVRCGLLSHEEAASLETAHSSPPAVVEAWISRWIQRHLKNAAVRTNAMQALVQLRAATGGIGALISLRAPVSFESLLYIAVYALCIIIPFGPTHVDYRDRRAIDVAVHVAIPLGHGVLIAFYFSLLHLLRHIQAPFDSIGIPHDCLNPLAILNGSERCLRDYLAAAPCPEAAAD